MKAAAKRRNICAPHSTRHSYFRHKLDNRWGSGHRHAEECEVFGKDFSIPFGSVLHQAAQEFESIAMDHDLLCGSPRIAGTRIPVYMVLDAVQHSGNIEGALTSYPDLTAEQVKDAVSFAGAVLEQPIEHEP